MDKYSLKCPKKQKIEKKMAAKKNLIIKREKIKTEKPIPSGFKNGRTRRISLE